MIPVDLACNAHWDVTKAGTFHETMRMGESFGDIVIRGPPSCYMVFGRVTSKLAGQHGINQLCLGTDRPQYRRGKSQQRGKSSVAHRMAACERGLKQFTSLSHRVLGTHVRKRPKPTASCSWVAVIDDQVVHGRCTLFSSKQAGSIYMWMTHRRSAQPLVICQPTT